MSSKQERAKRRDYRTLPQASAAVDAASERDRAYFAAHPDRDTYIRRRLPGEFGPADGDLPEATYVEVRQIMPGVRQRMPVQALFHRDFASGHIPSEYLAAVINRTVANGGQWRGLAADELDDSDGQN